MTTKIKNSKYYLTISCFLCSLVVIIVLINKYFSSNSFQEPTLSKRYLRAYTLYTKNRFNKSLNLFNKVYEQNEMSEDRPRSTYMIAQINRKFAEHFNKSDIDEIETPIISENTASADYLNKAIKYYQKLLKEYPKHFLADDALRWIGGCLYNKGLYIDALETYIQLLKDYPQGDQAVLVGTDIKWCFNKVMKNWNRISESEKLRFFYLLRKDTVATIPWEFPQDSWKIFSKTEAQELMQVLNLQNKKQDFLWSAGFANSVAHIYPLEQGINWWLFDALEHVFFTGDFSNAFLISKLIIEKANIEKKASVESFFWASSIVSNGPKKTFELCLDQNIHNCIVAIAFDWLTLNDLQEITLQKQVLDRPQVLDELKFIIGMRFFALEEHTKALNSFFSVVGNNFHTKYDLEAWQKILEIEYFFDIPTEHFLGVSNYVAFQGFLGESPFRKDLIEIERSFWGETFRVKNALLLSEIYKEYSSYEKLIFIDKNKNVNEAEVGKLQDNFLKFMVSSVAQIHNAPYFESIPESSQKALEGILDIAINRKKFDFYGKREKFSRQKSIFKQVLIPYIKSKNIHNEDELRKNVLPLLAILWNLSNIGEVPYTDNDRRAYYDYEKGTYYVGDEALFRAHIPIYSSSWTAHVIDLVYFKQQKRTPLFLQGYNYFLAQKHYLDCLHTTKDRELMKKAIFMSGKSHEFYARTLENINSRWLDTVDTFYHYISKEEGYSRFSEHSPDSWQKEGLFVPFVDDWQKEINFAIEQNTLFTKSFAKDPLTDDSYYSLGELYMTQKEYSLAKDSFSRAIALNDDLKGQAKEGLKISSMEKEEVDTKTALLTQIWLEFFWNNYSSVLDLYSEYKDKGYMEMGDSDLIYVLGVSNLRLNNKVQALTFFNEYLAQEPDGKFITTILALIPTFALDTEEMKDFIELVNIYINDSSKWLHIGFYKIVKAQILELLGNKEEAQLIYNDLMKDKNIFNNEILLLYFSSELERNKADLKKLSDYGNLSTFLNNKITSIPQMLLNEYSIR
jgi:tetratricopeptide (TPR) repeat protein